MDRVWFAAAGPGTGYTIDPETLLPVPDDPSAMRRAAEELLAADGVQLAADGTLLATADEDMAVASVPGTSAARALRISAAAWMVATSGDPARADLVLLTTLTNDVGWTARQRAIVTLRHAQIQQMLGHCHDALTLARDALALAMEAATLAREALTLAREALTLAAAQTAARSPPPLEGLAPPDPLVATALHHLGKALLDVGALDEAAPVLHRALALRERAGDPDLVASTRLALAVLDRRLAAANLLSAGYAPSGRS